MMKVKITNICARFSTKCFLDLNELYKNKNFLCLTRRKYQKNKFSALICKFKSTSTTFLIYSTGSIIIIGAKRENYILKAIEEFVLLLNIIGQYEATINDFRITNYCISFKLEGGVDLTRLADDKKDCVSYETELFVNAKYKFNNIIFTITHKGCIFATGIRSKEQIEILIKGITEELQPYIKNE